MNPERMILVVAVLVLGTPHGHSIASDEAPATKVNEKTPVAEAANPGVDLVRLRLLRMETRRWLREAGANIDADETFDDWAFGGAEGARRFRQQLDLLLERKLRDVKQLFALTDVQERKLRLAGKGDLERVLDLVEDARHEFDRCRTDHHRLIDLQKDLSLIELRVAEGPFELGSLFSKTLRKLYDNGQLARRPTAQKR